MVKLKGQMLSLDASGTIAGTMTYSNWKGRSYAKRTTKPTNNSQTTQQAVRKTLTFLSQAWAALSAADKATWAANAANREILPFNDFIGYNVNRITDGRGLTKQHPAAETAYTGIIPTPTTTIYHSHIEITSAVLPGNVPWYALLYRSAATGFTPAPSNLIGCVPAYNAPTLFMFRDVPPSRGTWYYRYASGNDDGTINLMPGELTVAF